MLKNTKRETSLVVQLFRLQASTAGDMGSIPGWETKILHACRVAKRKKNTKKGSLLFCYIAVLSSERVFSRNIIDKGLYIEFIEKFWKLLRKNRQPRRKIGKKYR